MFLNNVFKYSLSNKREKFSILDLYNQSVQKEQSLTKQEQTSTDEPINEKEHKEL